MKTVLNLPFVKPLLVATTLSLGACSSSSGDPDPMGGDTEGTSTAGTYAFAAVGSGGSGQIERISFGDGFTIDATYPAADSSDISADTDGTAIYQIGRFQLDSLTKFNATDTSKVDFNFSTNSDTEALPSNPYDVVFLSETKAYVLRYGSPFVWIVNPSATLEEDFKIGEIDLSVYDPDLEDMDLSPNPTNGVIVGDKLYILLQRLSTFSPIKSGYVAVIDTNTDTEIDTGKGEADSLMGIPLGSLNPEGMQVDPATGDVLVTGRGNIYVEFNGLPADSTPPRYSGGVFAINPTTYDINQIVSDGGNDNNNGFIERTVIATATKGYVTLYAEEPTAEGVSRNTLHSFNPMTGEIGEPVAGITDTVANLALGPNGNVWIGVKSDSTPGFVRLNPADDSIVEPFIQTSVNPLNVVFIEAQ